MNQGSSSWIRFLYPDGRLVRAESEYNPSSREKTKKAVLTRAQELQKKIVPAKVKKEDLQ